MLIILEYDLISLFFVYLSSNQMKHKGTLDNNLLWWIGMELFKRC